VSVVDTHSLVVLLWWITNGDDLGVVATGSIVDNKMRSKVWSILLLECDTSAAAVKALGPLSAKNDASQEMHAEDARVLDADVKRTR